MTTRDEFAALAAEAGDGQLRIDPDVVGHCVAECDAHIDRLRRLANRARYIMQVGSFGAMGSAQALAGKFETLAMGADGTGSYLSAIRAHISAVEQMRDMFYKAGQAFTAMEQGSTASVDRAVDPGR